MNIMFRRDIGNRLNDITRRFDQIAESKNKFLLRESVRVRERPTEVDEWRQTSSLVVEPKVYGREDDKEKIVKFLLAQVRDSEFLSVYAIVGLGGVGKTTLAQVVYNDVRYAFRQDREERAEIVTIGKEIVKKCGGLPLAAQALGGLMHSRSGEKGWLEIKDNKLWALPHGNFIFPALSLSYSHLTPTLKQCFAFCAVFPKAQEANLIGKKDLNELCLSWTSKGIFTGGTTPTLSAEQLLKVLQPQTNLKRLTINYYKGLCFPSWITILSSLVTLELRGCRCVSVLPLGKLPSLISLKLFDMDSVKYMDDDGSPNAMEVRVFSSLRVLVLEGLPNLEWILKVERREMFPCLSTLRIEYCPKLELPCLPSVKNLHVHACNNEVLRSISSFYGLTTLHLRRMEGITSFPEGMLKNLNCLQTLEVRHFPKLKELPNKSFNLTLERLDISYCDELESLPEQIWEGYATRSSLFIRSCGHATFTFVYSYYEIF
ncbi:NBS-LRR resistance protein [Trifolium pratense]|uniref:NBS-LRR resistance protein n=1 Tax=Trifolium pratense TaxID=57577 RepID=A0A2K3NVJ0_TRIPR|nr:NBS-LRR resistance protein [Trifolium pratense]